MGRGRKPNVPEDIKNEIKERVCKNPSIEFIDEVLDKTKEYNIKQSLEFLSHIASLDCIKKLNYKDLDNKVILDNAKIIANKVGCKEEYNDPDQYSLVLYMVFGKFLLKQNVLTDYEIICKNYTFAIKGKYKQDEHDKEVILGTDGISINKINNYHYDIKHYKKLGGFLIWPRHANSINQLKGIRLGDRWDKTMQEVEKFYNNDNEANRLIINQEDIVWMNYIGKIKDDRQGYDSFKILFELDDVEYDPYGIITENCLERRNEKMWTLLKK